MYSFRLNERNNMGIDTNVVNINEPVGFDSLEFTISRNPNSHGMSAEFSEIALQFDCEKSVEYLENAYNNDIDSNVFLNVQQFESFKGNPTRRLFFQSWKIDFAKYSKKFNNGVCYIEVGVFDNDTQVIFNNRIDQQVDLDSRVAFDGVQLPRYQHLKENITLPNHNIEIKSALSGELTWSFNPGWSFQTPTRVFFLQIEHNQILFNDLKTVFEMGFFVTTQFSDIQRRPFFRHFKDENEISVKNFKVKLHFPFLDFTVAAPNNATAQVRNVIFRLYRNNIAVYAEDLQFASHNWILVDKTFNIDIPELNDQDSLSYYFEVTCDIPVNWVTYSTWGISTYTLEVSASSSFRDTQADVSFVHEAFSRVAESITNGAVRVRSDYYGRRDSNVFPTQTDGKGSFKAITTGLRVRNAPDIKGEPRLFTISFADLFKSLQPIDCIGFGFFTNVLRIEPIEFFYRSELLLEINDSNNIERKIDHERLYSRFECGYNRHEVENEYNAIEVIHSTREYRTRLKLLENVLQKHSDFVADSIIIENTRRRIIEDSTRSWRFDNDIFLFCLGKDTQTGDYVIDAGINETDGTVYSPETLYNTRITPARMAEKWLDLLLRFGFGRNEELIFTSGVGNIQAKGSATPSGAVVRPDPNTEVYEENQDFSGKTELLLPELIVVNDYTITRRQYEAVKNNPYGIVRVNGQDCHIKEFKYQVVSNKASLELIPKMV